MHAKKSIPYTLIDHTADLGMRVYGDTQEQLFENAALALIDLLVTGVGPSDRGSKPIRISAEGDDPADLMVRWLGEILYLFQGETLILTSIKVQPLETRLVQGRAEAVQFDPQRHDILNDIKAVTYHRAVVTQREGRWEAQIIFDV
ncbi:MAG: archease [Desulfobacteraceae bacterium]